MCTIMDNNKGGLTVDLVVPVLTVLDGADVARSGKTRPSGLSHLLRAQITVLIIASPRRTDSSPSTRSL